MNTPVTLINKTVLTNNISSMQALMNMNSKLLMPMMKTHKSTEIAKIQLNTGCFGFLCGTIEECIAAYTINTKNIMYAYPVINIDNIKILSKIAQHCNMILRSDSYECVDITQDLARKSGICFGMTVIVDSGLHRFGLDPYKAAKLAEYITKKSNIRFLGFSTHPGHVYQKTKDQVAEVANDECESLKKAEMEVRKYGIESVYITSGSTPTVKLSVESDLINVFHPGNYVFNDYIQMILGSASEEECALYVSACVISNPEKGIFIIDAGAKCLGLDKGAHGNAAISGYGYVKKHPKAIITSLSEEVGIIHAKQEEFRIGDIVQIIPNHSCATANLTSRLYFEQNDNTDNEYIKVDIRSNSYSFQI